MIEFKPAMMIGCGPRVYVNGLNVGRIERRGPYGARKWQFVPNDGFDSPVPPQGFESEADAQDHVACHLEAANERR